MQKKILGLFATALAFGLAACGDDNSSSSAEQSIKDKSISGVSQKGPFVTGSAIKLYELDSQTLAQTGKSFAGKITSNNGEFSVSSISLESHYAMLEATGYYRNEITGSKSSGTITLNALTDLSDRENVNINLLTHLEYDRAQSLIDSGNTVAEAKKQAESEIFNAFEIQGNFANSEDLSIFSEGDGNAALLAFSVLMLNDLSEADLTERMTNFSTDVGEDGEWDDEATKAKIADWAKQTDLDGGLASIRTNIENWELGTVPGFEKYVRNFWYKNYGLGECSSDNEGTVLTNTNDKSSNYGTQERFICKDNAWVVASDIEKDTYQWEAGEDGEVKKGNCTDTYYKYDEILDQWVEADNNDVNLNLQGCTTSRTDEIRKGSDESSYYCYTNGWIKITEEWSWDVPKEIRLNPNIEYGTMTDDRDGQTYKTVVIGEQTWMAENLNYADSIATPSLKGASWCYSNNDKYCAVTGRLYTWAAAIDSVALANDADNPQTCGCGVTCTLPTMVQGICPEGWHLPSNTEWSTLITTVGGEDYASTILKSSSGWNRDGNGTDTYGFSVLPAGNRNLNGDFSNAGAGADFWSSTESSSDDAYGWNFDFLASGVHKYYTYKIYAFSVRCVRNSN